MNYVIKAIKFKLFLLHCVNYVNTIFQLYYIVNLTNENKLKVIDNIISPKQYKKVSLIQ